MRIRRLEISYDNPYDEDKTRDIYKGSVDFANLDDEGMTMNLSQNQIARIFKICSEYVDIFATSNAKLVVDNLQDYKARIGGK